MNEYLCVSLSYYPGQKIECCGTFLDLSNLHLFRIRPIDLIKSPLRVGDKFTASLKNCSVSALHDSYVIQGDIQKIGSVDYYSIVGMIPRGYIIKSVQDINVRSSKVLLPIRHYEVYRSTGTRSPKIRFWDCEDSDQVLPFKGIDLSHGSFSQAYLLIGNSDNLQINLGVGLLHLR